MKYVIVPQYEIDNLEKERIAIHNYLEQIEKLQKLPCGYPILITETAWRITHRKWKSFKVWWDLYKIKWCYK